MKKNQNKKNGIINENIIKISKKIEVYNLKKD